MEMNCGYLLHKGEFTRTTMNAPIQVVLGGHGVVARDLYGLVEARESGRLEMW